MKRIVRYGQKSQILTKVGEKVMVSTNGEPIGNRVTYIDVRNLLTSNRGGYCVIINGEAIFDEKYWRKIDE